MTEKDRPFEPKAFSIMDSDIQPEAKPKTPQPVVPRPASTCILTRLHEDRLEIFLTKRLQQMRFASGHHVFPGGKVETSDQSPQIAQRLYGRTVDEVSESLPGESSPQRALGFWIAAVRELFEEAGVLLARDQNDRPVHDLDDADLGPFRDALLADDIVFDSELEKRGWRLDLSQLKYFDHWVTPEYVPIRFDTRFFLARMAANAEAQHWPGEADEGFWIGPQQALERWERKELLMIPPTFMSIRRLLDLPDVITWVAQPTL